MGRIKVVVNPVAGRGRCARLVPPLHEQLTRHGFDYDLTCTEAPGHALELARQALADGFETILAVGGDGTAHEVVNGMLTYSQGSAVGTMSAIPVGSGSDFAHMLGMPAHLGQAFQRLVQRRTKWVDVGLVTDSQGRSTYFDNTVGIGFDGVVTLEAIGVKHLRGMALYLPVVLKTVFLSMKPPRVVVEFDDQRLQERALMITVCIGQREGGGFVIAPDAQSDDGLFDVCVAGDISRLQMLALIPHFMKGTHVHKDAVSMYRTTRLTVGSPDDLVAHIDGEMLCTKEHLLEFSILPRRLQVIY